MWQVRQTQPSRNIRHDFLYANYFCIGINSAYLTLLLVDSKYSTIEIFAVTKS